MILEGSAYVDDSPADASLMVCDKHKGPELVVKGALVLQLDNGEVGQANRVVFEFKDLKEDTLQVGSEVFLNGYDTVVVIELVRVPLSNKPLVGKAHLLNIGTSSSNSIPVKWLVGSMSEQRKYGFESLARYNSVDHNLRLWEEMKKGSAKGLECCVRAKIGISHKNKCMRDPVMYRCVVDTPHTRFGDKYDPSNPEKEAVLINIPDGKSSMSLLGATK